ncbi:MAG: hypothetical protein ACYDDQ_03685 [Vulcanimicrobiaceae bacterium]
MPKNRSNVAICCARARLVGRSKTVETSFGTASRAKYIATSVADGRAIIFPTGGHALVDHYADALREITSFLQFL